DDRRKKRLALFCNVDEEAIFSNPDQESIYLVPLVLEQQQFAQKVLQRLDLKSSKKDLRSWEKLAATIQTVKNEVNIAIVGKYFTTGEYQLSDVYVSIIESLKHAAWGHERKPVLHWIDSEKVEEKGTSVLQGYDGYVVTPGFGSRGIEGLIQTAQYGREHKKPYLGLCYGMQMAVIEFARNVLGLSDANTIEVDPKTKAPVIHLMPDQEKKLLNRDYGATMRLGRWECILLKGTKTFAAYAGSKNWAQIVKRHPLTIAERHRHRYEFNNDYRARFEKAGMVIAGTSPDGLLVEVVELADHPFFIGTQFHPEFQSRPLMPQPLFSAFVQACLERRKR
ncbi:MAG: CTP synthase, partial [bacterium]|nr:CTP synthase [bacterium]